MQFRGIIEGFYGTPWSWDARVDLLEWAVGRGFGDYAYAPKDDPKHRAEWRTPYDEAELDGFARLADVDGARVWFAVSPGLSIDYDDADDRATLLTKFHALVDHGVHGFVLAVDDIPPTPGLGAAHGHLSAFLAAELDGHLLLVPTDYTSTAPTTYLRELADSCPETVPIGWTGTTVVCDEITLEQTRGRAAALGGRKPWLWDNYPVNDAFMADRLFMGPLRGREPGVAAELSGYFANGGERPLTCRPAFASAAAWCDRADPEAAWAAFVDDQGWRVLAEGCDGEVPTRLVADVAAGTPGAVDAALAWFEAAAEVAVPALAGDAEAARWIDRLAEEAAIAVAALRAETLADFVAEPMMRWQRLKTSAHSVLGPRRSFRPVFGQDDHGGFGPRPGCWQLDRNALDHLMRARLAHFESAH